MTWNEFRWNVLANLVSALILVVVGAIIYRAHERRAQGG